MDRKMRMSHEYITVDNIQHCEGAFRSYMSTKYGVSLSEDDGSVRRTLYGVMIELLERHGDETHLTLKDMNNLALNIARDIVMREQEHAAGVKKNSNTIKKTPHPPPDSVRRPNVKGLERDHDLFGDRAIAFGNMIPMASSTTEDVALGGGNREMVVNRLFDAILEERGIAASAVVGPSSRGGPATLGAGAGAGAGGLGGALASRSEQERQAAERSAKQAQLMSKHVDAMSDGEFERRIRQLTGEREMQWAEALAKSPPPPSTAGATDGSAVSTYTTSNEGPLPTPKLEDGLLLGRRRDIPESDPADAARQALREADAFKEAVASRTIDSRTRGQELLIAPPKPIETIERFIGVNGVDRDLASDPRRYSYTVRVGNYDSAGLQASYRDVGWLQATSLILPMEIVQPVSTSTAPKPFFNYEFSFAYPYVLLMLEGFDNVYDGTNEPMRRAFCMFVYHRSYKAPNGRGYVLLEPAQEERKTFATPLASLRNLRVSVSRPNGALFNNSVDDNTVITMQYEPSNRLYLKMVCDHYFDRNDFYVGDMVLLQSFRCEAPSSSSSSSTSTTSAIPQSTYDLLNTFANRAQGHEVVQLGNPNDQGFYKTLYVLAPGVLDQGAGRIIVDANLIGAINSLSYASNPATVVSNGRLMNMSLQNVVTFTAGVGQA